MIISKEVPKSNRIIASCVPDHHQHSQQVTSLLSTCSHSCSLLVPCEGEKRALNYQTPNWVTGQLGGKSAKMQCYQNYTQHGWMYWYQQKKAEGRLEQIGILMDGTAEPLMLEGFQDGRFIMSLETNQLWSLQITTLQPEDTARYFCSSSLCCKPLGAPQKNRAMGHEIQVLRVLNIVISGSPIS